MLTIFTAPKPFTGHIGLIQRNAIRSWKRIHPECQVILCGDEPGCRAAADELCVEHLPDVELNEFGTPLLSSVFRRAEERSVHRILCYVNADLILFSDLLGAVRSVSDCHQRFLMVGSAWDLDVSEEIDPDHEGWDLELRDFCVRNGSVRSAFAIDYFVFPRAALPAMPAFAVGRPGWDNWMIYEARRQRIPVVDVTQRALVIHQLHGYQHVPRARGGKWHGPEGDRNYALAGVPSRLSFTLDDATHRLTSVGVVRSPTHRGVRGRLRAEARLAR